MKKDKNTVKAKIIDEQTIFIAWQNTDLTEGRGYQLPLYFCQTRETAQRLGAGKDVQGSDCYVSEGKRYLIEYGKDKGVRRDWFAPSRNIEPESAEDKAIREKNDYRELILKKAREAGLSEEEIKFLRKS